MATSITTRQHLTHWLANVTCGPGTRRSYLAAIHQLLSFITGDPPLAAISLKEFRAYLCTLHIKDKTATKYLYTIRAILRSAWKAGIITQKPEKVFPIISGEITHIKPRLSHGSSLPFFLSPVQREAIGQHIQLMIDQGHSVEKAAAKIASAYQIGGISECSTDIRLIFAAAVGCGATSMIFAHNHPSGDTTPSVADRNFTRQLRNSCEIMRIQLADAMIITEEGFFSFRESGVL